MDTLLAQALIDGAAARWGAPRWPTPGAIAHHIDPRTVATPALDLIDAFVARIADTPDGRGIVTMPPQEGKSVRCSRDLPVWQLTRDPDCRIVMGSYAQGLANRNGRAVRNAIAAHPDLGISIARDNGAASEWTLEGHQGGVISVGRGAGITGRPADLLIIDDPIKDRAEADSLTIRDTCWDWWTDALAARLAPGASVILIQTRWHEDDLAGRLLTYDRGAPWELLNIPAQCDDPDTDPLGRQAGEFMQSARLTPEVDKAGNETGRLVPRTRKQWEQRKATAGPRTWNALYQGRPSPAEGGILRRDWWRYWTTVPTLDGRMVASWDLTFKDASTSDYVVGQVCMRRGADAYLLDQVRGRWSFTETVAQVEALAAKWPQATTTLIEDKANGPAVIDSLRLRLPGIVPVSPKGGKEARAAAVEPFLAAGNIHLPHPSIAPWVASLVEEAAAFPNATHDDQVDALTQALAHLYLTATLTLGRF